MLEATSSDGVQVAVHDLGGDGPPLLFAHATGFCGHVWDPVARALAGEFHCWALDFRGHGDTTPPPAHHFDWNGFADDVLAAVDAAGLAGPVGVGHSKGAAALLLAEARQPGTFSRLVCFEPIVFPFDPPPGPMPDDQLPLIGGALRRRPSFPNREEALANFSAKPPLSTLHPDALAAYVAHGLRDGGDGTVSLKCEPADEAQVYRMGSAHDAYRRLPEIGCPVLVVCGEHTDAIRPDHARLLAERLPAGRAQVMAGLGHFGPLEDPAAFAAVCRDGGTGS